MRFADSGAVSGFACVSLLLVLVLLAWVLYRRAKERQAEAQRRHQYGEPPRLSLTRTLAAGISAHLIAGIVKAVLGHRRHDQHNDRHGWSGRQADDFSSR
jgi:hypothetical protein